MRNFKTGELLVQKSLGSDVFGIVAEFARRNGADVMTYEGDTIICENPDNEFIQIESRINGLPVKRWTTSANTWISACLSASSQAMVTEWQSWNLS